MHVKPLVCKPHLSIHMQITIDTIVSACGASLVTYSTCLNQNLPSHPLYTVDDDRKSDDECMFVCVYFAHSFSYNHYITQCVYSQTNYILVAAYFPFFSLVLKPY